MKTSTLELVRGIADKSDWMPPNKKMAEDFERSQSAIRAAMSTLRGEGYVFKQLAWDGPFKVTDRPSKHVHTNGSAPVAQPEQSPMALAPVDCGSDIEPLGVTLHRHEIAIGELAQLMADCAQSLRRLVDIWEPKNR